MAVAAPTEQKVPAGHVKHCDAAVITVSDGSFRDPAGHGTGTAAPSAQ